MLICFYAHNGGLAARVVRAAKARAAEQGESLKDWFTRVVAGALGRSAHATTTAPRPWPVFGKAGGKRCGSRTPSSRTLRPPRMWRSSAAACDDRDELARCQRVARLVLAQSRIS